MLQKMATDPPSWTRVAILTALTSPRAPTSSPAPPTCQHNSCTTSPMRCGLQLRRDTKNVLRWVLSSWNYMTWSCAKDRVRKVRLVRWHCCWLWLIECVNSGSVVPYFPVLANRSWAVSVILVVVVFVSSRQHRWMTSWTDSQQLPPSNLTTHTGRGSCVLLCLLLIVV